MGEELDKLSQEEYEIVKIERLRGTHTSQIDTPEHLMKEKYGINIENNPRYVVEFLNGGAYGDFDDYVATDYVVYELQKRKRTKPIPIPIPPEPGEDEEERKKREEEERKKREEEERKKREEEERKKHEEEERKKREEEENKKTYFVVRVDHVIKTKILPSLAAGMILPILFGVGLKDEKTERTVVDDVPGLAYSAEELIRDQQSINQLIEKELFSFITDSGIAIGDVLDLGNGKIAYNNGKYDEPSVPISGLHNVTGFAISSDAHGGKKYKYDCYTNNGDATDETVNFPQGIALTVEEFLKSVDASQYNVDDFRFAICFDSIGWVNFDHLVRVHSDKVDVSVSTMVDVIKKGASFDGFCTNVNARYINIAAPGQPAILLPIKDKHDQLYAPGTVVQGTDGKEYILNSLEYDTQEFKYTEEEVDTKLCFSITKCDLLIGLVPIVAIIAAVIANEIKNQKAKKNPNFFKFDTAEHHEAFVADFTQALEDERHGYQNAKEEYKKATEDYKAGRLDAASYENAKVVYERAKEKYRDSSTFGAVLKRIFISEKVHVAADLTESQYAVFVKNIVSAKKEENGIYTYNEKDRIFVENGRIVAYRTVIENGETKEEQIDITSIVAGVGKNNQGIEGLLTDGIINKHGGGKRL